LTSQLRLHTAGSTR